jgi:F0F1-type ATP synthase assembly protein I
MALPTRPEMPQSPPAPKRSGGALGGQLVMCVLVGAGLGYGLDAFFGWPHWGMIGGIMVGFAAWLWELWKLMR